MPRTRSTRLLTLDTVVTAALEVAATEGLEGITIRAVAQRCGVSNMTIYTYVESKEGLLSAVADRYLSSIVLPDPGTLPWREEVAAVFRAVQAVFVEHPKLAAIVANQSVDGVAAYAGAEIALSALLRAGLSDDAAVSAFDALSSYTAGFTQRDASHRAANRRDRERLEVIARLPVARYPQVTRLAEKLVDRDSARSFDHGLSLLIDGIAGDLA